MYIGIQNINIYIQYTKISSIFVYKSIYVNIYMLNIPYRYSIYITIYILYIYIYIRTIISFVSWSQSLLFYLVYVSRIWSWIWILRKNIRILKGICTNSDPESSAKIYNTKKMEIYEILLKSNISYPESGFSIWIWRIHSKSTYQVNIRILKGICTIIYSAIYRDI